MLAPWKKSHDQFSIFKSRDITLPTKLHLCKAMVFPVVMYGCESWTIKRAEHRRTDVFELWCWRRLFKCPLDSKEIQLAHPESNESWIFTIMNDTEAEAPVLWLPYAKNWLVRKDPDAGEDWSQEKREEEDKMVGWHHQLNGYEFEQALGDGEGQESLTFCSPWGLQTVRHDWVAELQQPLQK